MEHVWANAPLEGILHLHWSQQPISTDDKYPCFLQIWFLLYTHIMLSFKWPNPPNSQSVKVVIYNPFPIYIIYIYPYIYSQVWLIHIIHQPKSEVILYGTAPFLENLVDITPCRFRRWLHGCSGAPTFLYKNDMVLFQIEVSCQTLPRNRKNLHFRSFVFFAPMGFTPGIQATTPTHSLLLEAGHCAYLLGSCWTETGCKILRHGGSPCQVNC